MSIFLADEHATTLFGQHLAKVCQAAFPENGLNIHLYGDLGAGKTTLVRGLVQYFLPQAKVKSPTYTLVESYPLDKPAAADADHRLKQIYHFDLYRLTDPEELEFMGGRDYFAANALCLVEWPSRGEGWLAEPDIEITLSYQPDGRKIDLVGHTATGKDLVAKFLASV